jgi:hypothetical protein
MILGGAVAIAALVGMLVAQDEPAGAAKGKGKGFKAAPKGPEPCDRACLEGFVNQYLDALIAHNIFGLPLASRVKFTENAQVLDLGDGLWNVTTGVGKYKLIVADPQSQEVGFLGTVLANDRPTTLALRLKLENRKISEIETLVTVSNPPPAAGKGAPKGPAPAPAGAAALDAMGSPDAVFVQAVPEGERRTREQLIAAANAYYDALERGDTNLVQFDDGCNRIENGVQMTNNPTPAGGGRAGAIDARALSCADQIASRVFANYPVVYPRRTPVVDEERQIVFGFFMYQQPGDLLEVESPGRGVYKFSEANSQPGFVEVAQAFKIAGGRIRRMEAMSTTVPYGTPDPFFPDSWRRAKQK